MNIESFTPVESAKISATSTSASSTFSSKGTAVTQLMVTNLGTNKIFIRWGVGAQTAVVNTDVACGVGTFIFNKGLADTVAVICDATETATVYISAGEGQ